VGSSCVDFMGYGSVFWSEMQIGVPVDIEGRGRQSGHIDAHRAAVGCGRIIPAPNKNPASLPIDSSGPALRFLVVFTDGG
jgi:hypothetical protein